MKKNKSLVEERSPLPKVVEQNGAGLQDADQDKNNFQFLIGRKGHYLHKRNGIFEACVQVEESKDHPEVEEFFKFTARRIPLNLFQQALAFLKAVYAKFKSEGAVLLIFKSGIWGIVIPQQEVTAMGVKYENNGFSRVVGSIHSHPGFSPQPSGTDHKDELNFDGIHIIVSGFDTLAEVTVHAVVNGVRFRLKPEYAIEGIENNATFPEQWLEKVSRRIEMLAVWDDRIEKPKGKEDLEDEDEEEEKCECCREHHKQCIGCEYDAESEFEWPNY